MSAATDAIRVLIVGGGFAGTACAARLAGRPGVQVTLVDRNNFSQFQPLLYQVATSQLPVAGAASSLRHRFRGAANVDVVLGDVVDVDLAAREVRTHRGLTLTGDVLVLAAGGVANFFGTPGAREHAFPLYSLTDALRLSGRIVGAFEDADRDPRRIDLGALNFVVVGGGATGTEVAGALGDMLADGMRVEYPNVPVAERARVHLIDHGEAVLAPFSSRAHAYAARALRERGVELHLRTGVAEVRADRVVLSDGAEIPTRCVVWGGGIAGSPLAAAAGLSGHGGRIEVRPDLAVAGHDGVFSIGDAANIPDGRGGWLPQLGSVAQQSGVAAADAILARAAGRPVQAFRYRDRGMMAMIGRGAAIAVLGPRRREIHGPPAFVAWLGVHALLLHGMRARAEATVEWTWDYLSGSRGAMLLDRRGAEQIDWGDDEPGAGSA